MANVNYKTFYTFIDFYKILARQVYFVFTSHMSVLTDRTGKTFSVDS